MVPLQVYSKFIDTTLFISSKLIVIIITGIVIAVLAVVGGGVYYYQTEIASEGNKNREIELNDDDEEVVNPVHDDDAVEFENDSQDGTDEA